MTWWRELAGRWLLVLRLADAYNRCDEDRAARLLRELGRREYVRALAQVKEPCAGPGGTP